MEVIFRQCNPFDIWIWFHFETVPSYAERQYIEELFDSWFLLGKLGGFNAENLQVQETGVELDYLTYDEDTANNTMMAFMHNMGEIEYQGTWGRCWFDLGTSDAFAFDVLINAFRNLSQEYVVIKKLIIGGENKDWPVDKENYRSSVGDYN